MDPISAIVAAIAAGASAALKDTAAEAVKDAYSGLKALIARRFSTVDVDQLEREPSSELRQAVMADELTKSDADADAQAEVLEAAKALLSALETEAPEAAAAVGVSLEQIKAANISIKEVIATGGGVFIRDAEATGDINIEKIRAGTGGQSENP